MALADKAKALALQSRPLGGQDPADTGDVGNGSKCEELNLSKSSCLTKRTSMRCVATFSDGTRAEVAALVRSPRRYGRAPGCDHSFGQAGSPQALLVS